MIDSYKFIKSLVSCIMLIYVKYVEATFFGILLSVFMKDDFNLKVVNRL